MLHFSPLKRSFIKPLSLPLLPPHLSMCSTCNGFSLICLNLKCPDPESDQVSTLNLRLPASDGLFNMAGGGKIQQSFSLPGNWFTTSGFLKMQSLHSRSCTRRAAFIRKCTEAEKTLFGLMAAEEVYSETKQTRTFSVLRQNCGPML